MANYELRFISIDNDDAYAKVTSEPNSNQIVLRVKVGSVTNVICFDKSTAIKLAKTLRTEINKITESEVNNG